MTFVDRDGYPTDAALESIRNWSHTDFPSLMVFIHDIWWPQGNPYGWKQRGRTYWMSTGGWSGNESVIGALKQNYIFWGSCWQVSWVGGHYRFHLYKFAKE